MNSVSATRISSTLLLRMVPISFSVVGIPYRANLAQFGSDRSFGCLLLKVC
ncbi:MAG: hypothetical protein ACREYE_08550 [Gammaproteobacteria bacterium]